MDKKSLLTKMLSSMLATYISNSGSESGGTSSSSSSDIACESLRMPFNYFVKLKCFKQFFSYTACNYNASNIYTSSL